MAFLGPVDNFRVWNTKVNKTCLSSYKLPKQTRTSQSNGFLLHWPFNITKKSHRQNIGSLFPRKEKLYKDVNSKKQASSLNYSCSHDVFTHNFTWITDLNKTLFFLTRKEEPALFSTDERHARSIKQGGNISSVPFKRSHTLHVVAFCSYDSIR